MTYTGGWIAKASKAFGVPLTRHTAEKAVGPCPYCHTGVDRFIVWQDGNAWCNQCHRTGWWLPATEAMQRVAAARSERAERQTELLARMAACTDWQTYQSILFANGGQHLADWYEHGISEDEIIRWGLGYCDACPLAKDSPSLTLPVFVNQRLVDIRHRLLKGQQGDKYRSHLAGLVPSIFNTDALSAARVVLVVEGEKKVIASVRAGFPASLGMPGAQFTAQLLDVLAAAAPDQLIVLALDPDKVRDAEQIALRIGGMGRVADFTMKPDDFLLRYGPAAYAETIRQAREVRAAH